MRYRTAFRLQQRYYSFGVANRDALAQSVSLHLGGAARVIGRAKQLDQVVVEYDLGGENQFDSHHSVLQRVERAASQLALQAVEAEVVQIVRYCVEAATVGGLTALGATVKQKGEVAFFAAVFAAIAGYVVGELLPRERVISRANRHPLYGWTWTEVPPPQQLDWRPATT
jgi:hypothetical protein